MFKYGEIVKVRDGVDYEYVFPYSIAANWPKHGEELVVEVYSGFSSYVKTKEQLELIAR
jgi:hypothetical protein